jgi:hypothetical protein
MDTFLQRSAPHQCDNTFFLFYVPPITTLFPRLAFLINSQPLRSRQLSPRHIPVHQAVRQYRNAGFSGACKPCCDAKQHCCVCS